MRESRPGKDYKLNDGARRLLQDLRHKGSRAVALEHKATAEGRRRRDTANGKEAARWYAGDAVLKVTEGHDRSRNEMAADWPHTTDPEKYCSICACFGCRAATPKE